MNWLRALVGYLLRRQEAIRSFDADVRSAGPLLGRADAGLHAVAVDQIVGSVGRWQSLRADFLNRTEPALTDRHRRIAAAMQADRPLPALQLYRLTIVRPGAEARPSLGQYYVVDGHHRVAMARRLGRAYLDAHIIDHRVAAGGDRPPAGLTARHALVPDQGESHA